MARSPSDVIRPVQPKTAAVTLKLTLEQQQLIKQRADKCGVNKSVWMRSILLQAATRTADAGYLRIREPDGVTT